MAEARSADTTAPPKVSIESIPHTPLTRRLDRIILRVGEISAYIWLLLVGVIIVNVVLRYVFGRGYIVFEEIQWHLFAIGFLLGLSYTMVRDGHVRVDILSEHWSLRRRAWIDLAGYVLLLLPIIFLVIRYAVPFVERAWTLNEVSAAPGGLPFRWVIKSFMIWGFLLLAVSTISRIVRCWVFLFGGRA